MSYQREQTPGSSATLIDNYMKDLEQALASLGHQDREEVITSIREHIDHALSANPSDVEETRRVLRDLGSVDDIAKEAVGDQLVEAAILESRGDTVAVAIALAAALLAPFIPIIAFAVALVQGVTLLASRRRTGWTKARLIAFILNVIVVFGLAFLLLGFTATTSESPVGGDIQQLPPPVSTVP